jgi:hypothetical protein
MFNKLLALTTEILSANLESTTKGSSLNVIVMMSVAMP